MKLARGYLKKVRFVRREFVRQGLYHIVVELLASFCGGLAEGLRRACGVWKRILQADGAEIEDEKREFLVLRDGKRVLLKAV